MAAQEPDTPRVESSSSQASSSSTPPPTPRRLSPSPSKKPDWRTAYVCFACKILVFASTALMSTPLERTLEADVCRRYYGGDAVPSDIAEEKCKIGPVQREVSRINGWQSVSDLVPSLLASLIYLAVLQRIGKKKTLLINVVGFLSMYLYYAIILYFYDTFNPSWIIATGLFDFVGGGYPVFGSIIPAFIAESVPQDSLSSIQLYMSAVGLLVRVGSTSLALYMMKTSLWVPVILGVLIFCLLIPLVYFGFRGPVFSRTQSNSVRRSDYVHLAADEEAVELATQSSNGDDDGREEVLDNQPKSAQSDTQGGLKQVIRNSTRLLWLVLIQNLVPCAVVSLHDVGEGVQAILPFWASKRYHWELRQVGWVKLGLMLFSVLVVALLPRFADRFLMPRPGTQEGADLEPALSYTSDTRHGDLDDQKTEDNETNHPVRCSFDDKDITPEAHCTDDEIPTNTGKTARIIQRDLSLASFCIILPAIGTFLLGLSWYRPCAIISLAIFAAGTGFQDAYYSYLAGITPPRDKENLASVYMMLAMVTVAGFRIGGALVAGVYSWALGAEKEGQAETWWTSLPIWIGTAAITAALWIMRRHKLVTTG